MSAKKLGRFAAGLFVALGLSFGGLLTTNVVSSTTAAAPVAVVESQLEFEWQ